MRPPDAVDALVFAGLLFGGAALGWIGVSVGLVLCLAYCWAIYLGPESRAIRALPTSPAGDE